MGGEIPVKASYWKALLDRPPPTPSKTPPLLVDVKKIFFFFKKSLISKAQIIDISLNFLPHL